MGVHVIRVPDLGEGIAEVELVVWHVAAGDTIVEDQGLADVMTDKASVEIPSPVAGKVLALGGEVGQMLAVGSELIRIEVEDAAGTTTTKTKPMAAPTPVPPSPPAATPAPAAASPRTPASAPPSAAAPPSSTPRPIASPAVRARAWELGIDLRGVTATVEGDIDLRGILGLDPEVRNGYEGIRVVFHVGGDAQAEQLAALVTQSRNRSAVFDVVTNGTQVSVDVATA